MAQRAPDNPAAVAPPGPPQHVLSFDVEEYFQAEASRRAGVRPDQWSDIPSRLGPCMERILTVLDEWGIHATFFFLGWLARTQPQWVRRCADAGHEIASHGMSHSMLTDLSAEQVRAELSESRALLEDLAGQRVRGFRAPTFSLTRKTAWAIDLLAETGYEYDSSVFPIRHDLYGVPDGPRRVHHAVGPSGGTIIELPMTTLRILGRNLPASGGGYLRLFPVRMISAALRQAHAAGQPGMLYLHPWEFDPGQPVLPMGRVTTWRHRVNLHRTDGKLQSLLRAFRFGSVRDLWPRVKELATEEFAYAPSRP